MIKIGEKIKLLRKRNDVTQDRLAEYLGVTAQAISRWESETCYPDIEGLPSIADFFGITLDELLCIDKSKKEKRISQYLSEGESLIDLGRFSEAVALYRKAVGEFPSSYKLQSELACALGCKNDIQKPNESELKEAISIYNRILEDCTDDEIRDNAKESLCCIYSQHDNNEKALEIAEKMHRLIYSRELMKATILKGDVAFVQSQECIELLTDEMVLLMRNISTCDDISGCNYSIAEKIKVMEKAIKLIELVFDGDYNFYYCRLAESYRALSWLNILNGDNEAALSALEASADYTVKYDLRPDESDYSSVLLNRITYKKHEYHEIKEFTASQQTLEKLKHTVYDSIRDTERFKVIIIKLSKNVK